MKKLIALVLTLAMIACTSVTAFAASEPFSQSAEMTATAYSYGSYVFEIPLETNFQKYMNTQCAINIYSYDLTPKDTIVVDIGNLNGNNAVTLNNLDRDGITADLNLYHDEQMSDPFTDMNVGKMTYEELEKLSEDKFYFYGLLSEDAPAGHYSGTIYFMFSILTEE